MVDTTKRQIAFYVDERTYYGLIAIGRKLAQEGKLRGFKGGVSKVAALALEAVVDSYIKTGQISEEDIENVKKEHENKIEEVIGFD